MNESNLNNVDESFIISLDKGYVKGHNEMLLFLLTLFSIIWGGVVLEFITIIFYNTITWFEIFFIIVFSTITIIILKTFHTYGWWLRQDIIVNSDKIYVWTLSIKDLIHGTRSSILISEIQSIQTGEKDHNGDISVLSIITNNQRYILSIEYFTNVYDFNRILEFLQPWQSVKLAADLEKKNH